MGRRGRPPLPKEIAKRQGCYKPSRHEGALELESKYPQMPRGLSADAKRAWEWFRNELEPLGVVTQVDAFALTLLANSMSVYLRAMRQVNKPGALQATVRGGQHPIIKTANAAWEQVCKMLQQFGMTPSSRSSVRPVGGESGEDNDLDAIMGGSLKIADYSRGASA